MKYIIPACVVALGLGGLGVWLYDVSTHRGLKTQYDQDNQPRTADSSPAPGTHPVQAAGENGHRIAVKLAEVRSALQGAKENSDYKRAVDLGAAAMAEFPGSAELKAEWAKGQLLWAQALRRKWNEEKLKRALATDSLVPLPVLPPPDALATLLRNAAETGLPSAQIELCELLSELPGKKGLEEAAGWLKQTADNGNPKAAGLYGELLYLGLGTAENVVLAESYFRKGEAASDPRSWYYLGLLLLRGEGTAKNEKLAVEYFTRASDAGYVQANVRLASSYLQTESDKAEQLYKKSLELHSPMGHFFYALSLSSAYHDRIDMKKAAHLYLRAAHLGNTAAMRMTALLLQQGRGLDRDYRAALKWLEAGAALDDNLSVCMLAAAYRDGLGTAADYDKALALLLPLNEKDHAAGNYELVRLYRKMGRDEEADRIETVTARQSLITDRSKSGILTFLAASDCDYAPAMIELGNRRRFGVMEENELNEAIEWKMTSGFIGYPENIFDVFLLHFKPASPGPPGSHRFVRDPRVKVSPELLFAAKLGEWRAMSLYYYLNRHDAENLSALIPDSTLTQSYKAHYNTYVLAYFLAIETAELRFELQSNLVLGDQGSLAEFKSAALEKISVFKPGPKLAGIVLGDGTPIDGDIPAKDIEVIRDYMRASLDRYIHCDEERVKAADAVKALNKKWLELNAKNTSPQDGAPGYTFKILREGEGQPAGAAKRFNLLISHHSSGLFHQNMTSVTRIAMELDKDPHVAALKAALSEMKLGEQRVLIRTETGETTIIELVGYSYK